MNDPASSPPDVPSPCIQVCALDREGVCTGCFRTMAEITEWPTATRARRIEIRRAAELRGRITAYHRRSSSKTP